MLPQGTSASKASRIKFCIRWICSVVLWSFFLKSNWLWEIMVLRCVSWSKLSPNILSNNFVKIGNKLLGRYDVKIKNISICFYTILINIYLWSIKKDFKHFNEKVFVHKDFQNKYFFFYNFRLNDPKIPLCKLLNRLMTRKLMTS